ncbi:MAG: helix-turn-helix domain-containing protein [Bacteroidota bacterium]
MLLTFPNFDIFSTPLLILATQGVVFGLLLLTRYRDKKTVSDLFLALLVLITCYHRTTYTIGFMDWYDTYRNTKINYWLVSLALAIGPLIYLYIKSVTVSDFKFNKKQLLHFIPVFIFVVYRIFIFIYDAHLPGFANEQNGVLMKKWIMGGLGTLTDAFISVQQLLYLAFSLQHYFFYRKNIRNYFSNTYKLELNWIRNFLFVYSFLFLYDNVQGLVDISIIKLSWIEKWWYQFFSALAVIYIGIKGYFTDTSTLQGLDFKLGSDRRYTLGQYTHPKVGHPKKNKITAQDKEKVIHHMDSEKPYLNPDLNLVELANALKMSRAHLSEIINLGFGKNFNDFINGYRINSVKYLLENGQHKNLSLLGIAYESGFNSKATFNRVFKKLTNTSPSEFLKTLQ